MIPPPFGPEPRPPAHVEPFVRVLGTDLAIEFLLRFGGAELYIAAEPQARGALAGLIGIDLARALAEVASGLPRRIPTAKPWIARVWKSRGLPVAEIARRLHSSDVAVRRWLRDVPGPGSAGDPRQPSLF